MEWVIVATFYFTGWMNVLWQDGLPLAVTDLIEGRYSSAVACE